MNARTSQEKKYIGVCSGCVGTPKKRSNETGGRSIPTRPLSIVLRWSFGPFLLVVDPLFLCAHQPPPVHLATLTDCCMVVLLPAYMQQTTVAAAPYSQWRVCRLACFSLLPKGASREQRVHDQFIGKAGPGDSLTLPFQARTVHQIYVPFPKGQKPKDHCRSSIP